MYKTLEGSYRIAPTCFLASSFPIFAKIAENSPLSAFCDFEKKPY
jgi:hypothetical protein